MCSDSTKDINYSNNPLHTLLDYFDILRTLIFNIRILFFNINFHYIMLSLKPSKKKELLKKYDKELKAGDALVMNKIEKELLDYCKEKLKDEPAMDNINSGAGADWGNNFKNMYVIKGAQKDPFRARIGHT